MVSVLIYSSVATVSILFAYFAKKYNKKLWIFLAACVLALITGLRGSKVGWDTESYIYLFDNVLGEKMDVVRSEIGFRSIVLLLSKISQSPNFMFFLFSLLTNSLILFRLWDFKEQISIEWAVFVYCAQFYFFSFNLVRQFIAVSMVFYASRYIKDKDYIVFSIITILAALFHVSALIGFLFLVIDLFLYKNKENKKKAIKQIIIIISLGVALLIALFIFKSDIFESIIKRSVEYFKSFNLNFGLMLPLKLFMLFFLFNFVLYERKNKYVNIKRKERCKLFSSVEGLIFNSDEQVLRPKLTDGEEYDFLSVFYSYGLGLFILLLEWFFPFTGRISFIFYLFECVFIGFVVKNCKNKHLKAIVLVLFLFIFFNDIVINTQGQTPYMFMWQPIEI